MHINLRIESVSRSALALVLVGCGLVACTTQEAKTTDGGSGKGGGGGGTTTGQGGSVGSGGGSGNTVACGTGAFSPTHGILCPTVPQLLTDFAYNGDSGSTDQARFGDDATMLSGGESTYANMGGMITSDVTQGDWHLVAHVANYSGFNLYFDDVNGCNMVDASAFAGITFTIWGTTGGNPITMGVGIEDDTPTPSWFASVTDGGAVTTPGSCIPTMGSQYYHPGCGDPTYLITVDPNATAASPQTVSLKWDTDFAGGTCEPHVNPKQIVSIYWQLAWSASMAPYDADIHIDNLGFIPK